jgi:phage protein D
MVLALPSAGVAQVVPVDVFTGQDFYVPSFKIRIGSDPANFVQDVMSVTYTDSLTNIDSCELTVNNWDPDKASPHGSGYPASPFKYSDADTFNPWQSMELWMGYIRNGVDERQKMLTGEITTMNPNFPATGASTLSVRALNLLHRFRVKQETKPFFNKKDSEIAEIIVGNIAKGLRKNVPQMTLQLDPDEIAANKKRELVIPYVALSNQYPINLLLERSREIGYELFVEEIPTNPGQRVITLHYRPTAPDKRTVYRLEWGKSLMSFQPTLQTANQVSSVTVRGWDPQGKTKIEYTANRADIKGIVHPANLDVEETGLSQKEEIVCDHPIQSQAEAKDIAENRLLRLAQGIVEARGKTVGLPNLRSGNKVAVAGLGKRFSGIYVVTSTTHTMGDGGYTTDFSARMEAKLNPA